MIEYNFKYLIINIDTGNIFNRDMTMVKKTSLAVTLLCFTSLSAIASLKDNPQFKNMIATEMDIPTNSTNQKGYQFSGTWSGECSNYLDSKTKESTLKIEYNTNTSSGFGEAIIITDTEKNTSTQYDIGQVLTASTSGRYNSAQVDLATWDLNGNALVIEEYLLVAGKFLFNNHITANTFHTKTKYELVEDNLVSSVYSGKSEANSLRASCAFKKVN